MLVKQTSALPLEYRFRVIYFHLKLIFILIKMTKFWWSKLKGFKFRSNSLFNQIILNILKYRID